MARTCNGPESPMLRAIVIAAFFLAIVFALLVMYDLRY